MVSPRGVGHWLGKFGTPESREEYDRLITEWLASGRNLPNRTAPKHITIIELIAQFLPHAEETYRQPDGQHLQRVGLLQRCI